MAGSLGRAQLTRPLGPPRRLVQSIPSRVGGLVAALLLPGPLHAQDRVTLSGTVIDSVSRRPIEQVTVYLMSGEQAVTDADGRFRLPGVPRTSSVVALRRIGYVPRAIPLRSLAPTADIEIGMTTMTPAAIALDSISVRARLIAQNPKLVAFYDRMRSGQGRYFTQSQIWNRNPLYVTEVIQTVAGVRCGTGSCTARTASFTGGCRMQVFLDGMRVDDFDLRSIPPSWIAGMEVYKGPATTPLEFGMVVGAGGRGRPQTGPACGTILIWTGVDELQDR